MARSPRRAGPRRKAARTAISRPRSGAAPGTAARSRSATSGTTNPRCRGTSTPSSARTTRPGASMTGGRSARRFRRRCRPARAAQAGRRQCRHRRRNLGHGCTNCYALPLGTGQNWDAGLSGIGPLESRWASRTSMSRATISTGRTSTRPAIRGTNGLRNQFDPFDIAWYDARQERNGGAHHRRPAADQQHLVLRLGLLQQPPRPLSEPVEPEPVGNQHRHRRRDPDVQPVLSGGQRAEQSARQLQSRLGKPEHHDVLRARAALSVRPQHRASRRLERPRLVLDDQGRELQPRPRHHQQERGLRGLRLDDRNGRTLGHARRRSAPGRSRPTFPI